MAWKVSFNYALESFKYSKKYKKAVLSVCLCGRETFDVDKTCAICKLEARFLGIHDIQKIKEYSKSCLSIFTSGHATVKELFALKENRI